MSLKKRLEALKPRSKAYKLIKENIDDLYSFKKMGYSYETLNGEFCEEFKITIKKTSFAEYFRRAVREKGLEI